VFWRQYELLQSAGYLSLATDDIKTLMSDEGLEQVAQYVATALSAPLAEESSTRKPPRGRGRRSAIERREGVLLQNAGDAGVADIAREYLRVGEKLGQPTPDLPQWRSLGPWTTPNGQTYGCRECKDGPTRINVSGRVSSIAIDPREPAHVLVGAANGGVWESYDRGASWLPRTDYQATLTVGALAFDPNDPSIVYCGTGEGNQWFNLGFGAGMLRSSDGGTTWSTLCTAPFIGSGFYDVVVDPADSSHLLVGTTVGLFVSADGGINWARSHVAQTWSLSITSSGGAAGEALAACSDGLWRSTDGGATWAAQVLPGAPVTFKRLAVAIAPSNPQVAYAWGAGNARAYLWRREGATWSPLDTPPLGNPPGLDIGQADYDWFLAVSPDRDTQIYCGAIDVHRADLSGGAWSWTNITSRGPGEDSIHPDQHAIAFEPGQPDTIYVGNDGGLYRSEDRGISWEHCNNGLVIAEFEYLAQHPGSSHWLIGGTQDNGTSRWSGSQIWEHIADGDGGYCGVNRTNPTTVFHTYYNMSPERSPRSGDLDSWEPIQLPVPLDEGSLFYPPFACSATTGDTISIGGDALYISRDNGVTWQRRTFPQKATSSALFIPNSDLIYVGTTSGQIYKTAWTNGSWSALTALVAPRTTVLVGNEVVELWVSDLLVDPVDLQRIWVTYRTIGGGRVFRSDDGGASWADCTANMPGLPINAIEVDPTDRNRVWVAADLGVYQSLDSGASWTDFSNGLPHAYVGDLILQPHARVLRAGTRNRGVWEIPVDGWLTAPVCAVQWTGTLAGNETKRWFSSNWPATWQVLWTVMPTTVRPGGPQLSWSVQVERADAEHATYWITVSNLTPDAVNFEGRYCVLSLY
jgi:photosystem II stability/assembly factor-like uncharacterized protein